jgi:ubiquinone/menaquinone biosynthesis C-methylase UbiE
MSTKNPLEIVGTTQEDNRKWWEENPMTYSEWGEPLIEFSEDDIRFYRKIDSVFFDASDHFSHADGNNLPFSRFIEFEALKGKRVLEIGCGQGSHAELISRAGAQYTGIDITETAVRRTRKRFELNGLTGQIIQMDAEKMAFPDSSFDFVWSWGVIHHSQNTKAIVEHIRRVLVPQGITKIMVYHKNSLRYYVQGGLKEGLMKGKLLRMSLYEINKRFTDGAIARHYTSREARRMFDRFDRVDTSVIDGEKEAYIPILGKYARKVMPGVMRRVDAMLQSRWGWFLFIAAKK